MKRHPWLWAGLNARAERRLRRLNAEARPRIAATEKPLAVIVGYGPVGRVVDAILRDTGMETVIIELNVETVRDLTGKGRIAIYGDAGRPDILEDAGIRRASHLVLTLPHTSNPLPLVLAARELNPSVEVTVRGRYVRDREMLQQAGATTAVVEEGEVGVALARQVMKRRGIDEAMMVKMTHAIRRLWSLPE